MVRKKKKKLSKEELKERRAKRKFKVDINTIFNNASFTHIPTRDKNFYFKDREIEIDNVFLYENIIVVSEDTTSKSIKPHLNKTAIIFSHIRNNQEAFIKTLGKNFEKFKKSVNKLSTKYDFEDFKIIFIYCSKNKFDSKYKSRNKNIIFLDYMNLQYFLKLSKTIKKSVRFELFKFLGLNLKDIGTYEAGKKNYTYDGFLLPESPSGYPKGHKIVSFLIEPKRLLEQSYVLRKDSWRDNECLYQRLLIPNKIKAMRDYLVNQKRVFVNNIIITLSKETNLLDKKGKQLKISKIKRRENVYIQIPFELNSIGIIDGQHRVYSYHEGSDKQDKHINSLRDKQHLLATGIIYPKGMKDFEKTKFEAKLFLEINDKQTRTKSDLKQAIETLISPFSITSISKKILNKLADTGPLSGYIEEYFFDTKKIKTSSIVSYGLKHIVKLSGNDSLYSLWSNKDKKDLIKREKILDLYVDFGARKINDLLIGFKKNIPEELWTLDKKRSRVLTTTTINGLIYCLRQLIENKKTGDIEYYIKKFKKMKINFKTGKFKYKSSHWKDLGEKIYYDCFK